MSSVFPIKHSHVLWYLQTTKAAKATSCYVMKGHNVELQHYCSKKKITSVLYSTARNTHESRKGTRHWQSNCMSRLHETLSAFSDLSVIALYHRLPVTLITAFQARARRAGYLDYILSVPQAPPSQNKLNTTFTHQERNNMKTLSDFFKKFKI